MLLTFLNNPKEKKFPTRKVSLHVDPDKLSSTILQEKRTDAPSSKLYGHTYYMKSLARIVSDGDRLVLHDQPTG